MGIAASNNGFLAKNIRFIGRAAHAGTRPELGVNALNAATLALSAIHAQRETFRDEDCVRVHPIITKGGDLVNIVPAEVKMETYVRAKTHEAVLGASAKVDRALRGAAMALGCHVEIETIPGSLPLRCNAGLARVFKENSCELFGASEYRDYPHSGGSTDAGDLSHIMPVLHPYMTGARGGNHSPQWCIGDFDAGYVAPAKTLAMMTIDLLGAGAGGAREILAGEEPAMSSDEYLRLQKEIFRREVFDGSDSVASNN
jgi:metal-dependent amidase/aminoacylase/carboxypeptidase family protein